MNNYAVTVKLEKIAMQLRDLLQIPDDYIINYEYLESLTESINKTFENINIESGYNMEFVLKDGKNINITYDNTVTNEEIFEFVTRAFLYGILLDKKSLNSYELQEYLVSEQTIISNDNTNYLFKAFLIPRKLFYKEMVKYTCGDNSRCDIESMTKVLKNKHIYSRGHDLNIW